jgi:hypothetical protein
VTRVITRFRIVEADSRPIAAAMLSVVRSSVPFPEIALLSDDQGVVEICLPPGQFTLRAQSPDGRTGEVTMSSPAGSSGVVDVEVSWESLHQ